MGMVSLEEAINKKYSFEPYSSYYKKIFSSEKKLIEKKLLIKKEIHHIGSTSVQGLGGKKIIDVLIVVEKKDLNMAKKTLEKIGFKFDHTLNKVRSFFFKYYLGENNSPRLIHLHLTFFGSGEKEKALAFRNYLNLNKKIKEEYELLKKLASEKHSGSGIDYKKFKEEFIVTHLGIALKEKYWDK